MLGLFKKNFQFRKLAMVSSGVGLNNWGNKIYGYHMEEVTYGNWKDTKGVATKQVEIQPFREKRSSGLFPVQIGFVPGAIIRRGALQAAMNELDGKLDPRNLVKLSTEVSFYLWETGRRVHVSPSTTYVSTDECLDSPVQFKFDLNPEARHIFSQEIV
jgi:hypothetical protein